MEKFTEEEIETALKVLSDYDNSMNPKSDMFSITYLKKYLESILKPKRRKIFLEIEFDEPDSFAMDKHAIRNILIAGCSEILNFNVEQLPEVFTREDMASLVRYTVESDATLTDFDILDNFLSERNKK